MAWYLVLLEYFRVIVSWPVALVIVALIFKLPLINLIGRLRSFSFPGMQLQAQQQPEILEPNATPNPPAAPLPAGLTLTPDQRTAVSQIFQAERATARLWEYRYLNHFLARSSQVVLDWLIGLNAVTTIDAYDSYWLPFIPDASQRRLILGALQGHILITIDGPAITVTDKGREYQVWRGQLPQQPAT